MDDQHSFWLKAYIHARLTKYAVHKSCLPHLAITGDSPGAVMPQSRPEIVHCTNLGGPSANVETMNAETKTRYLCYHIDPSIVRKDKSTQPPMTAKIYLQ